MAELNNAQPIKKPYGSSRPKTLTAKVDLTAMVDLAFLLITFFMLTTSLAKQNHINVAMPVDGGVVGKVDERRTMTICLAKNNVAVWYLGLLEKPIISLSKANYGTQSLQKALSVASAYSKSATGKHLVVLIKPSQKSNYKNLVDVLDAMEIGQVQTYSISDLSKSEIDALKRYGTL